MTAHSSLLEYRITLNETDGKEEIAISNTFSSLEYVQRSRCDPTAAIATLLLRLPTNYIKTYSKIKTTTVHIYGILFCFVTCGSHSQEHSHTDKKKFSIESI